MNQSPLQVRRAVDRSSSSKSPRFKDHIHNPANKMRRTIFSILASGFLLSACVSADTRRELEYRRAEVAAAEARLINLAPDDKRAPDLRKAVAEARGRLDKARTRADRERREGMGFFSGLFDKVMSGASPLLSLLVPGGGFAASMAGRLVSTVTGAIASRMRS